MSATAPLPAKAAIGTVSSRVAGLDGLRAIAMLLVVVMHCYSTVPSTAGSASKFFMRLTSLGYTGVDLFFVLSGFLIGGILLDHQKSPRLMSGFYARRVFRILPVYLLLLASFYLCQLIPGLNGTNQGAYFRSRVPEWTYFVFLQNVGMAWLAQIGPYWLGPSWSLAVEEQFYLAAPFFIRRLTIKHVAWGSVVVIALSPLLRMCALHYAHNPLAGVFLLATRADGLMWGVLLACLVRHEAIRPMLQRQGMWLGILIVGGGLVFGYASARQLAAGSAELLDWGYSVFSAWFAFIVLGVVLFPQAIATRLLGWRPLAAIGVTSYFSYLFHVPILYLLHWLFFHLPPKHTNWQNGSVTVLAVVATLIAAWASGRWFDGPLTKYGRRFTYE